MKIIAVASAAFVSLAALTGVASANSIVPGSDYFTDVQADYEANTVIAGVTQTPGTIATTSTRQAFGYPVAGTSTIGIIPGSRLNDHDEETRDINAVARGDFSRGAVNAPVVNSRLVPGSGSF